MQYVVDEKDMAFGMPVWRRLRTERTPEAAMEAATDYATYAEKGGIIRVGREDDWRITATLMTVICTKGGDGVDARRGVSDSR